MALPRRLDLWLPPLLLMGIIYLISAQPSLDSGLGFADLVGRKVLHVLEYALLCFLWWRALQTRMSAGRAALVAFLLSSAYAATDELHQTLVEGRVGSPVDWALDSAGAAAVALRQRMSGRRTTAA